MRQVKEKGAEDAEGGGWHGFKRGRPEGMKQGAMEKSGERPFQLEKIAVQRP